MNEMTKKRNEEIFLMHRAGVSYARAAEEMGMPVEQIIKICEQVERKRKQDLKERHIIEIPSNLPPNEQFRRKLKELGIEDGKLIELDTKSRFRDRDMQIVRLYNQGLSKTEVGRRFGVSRQRVQIICDTYIETLQMEKSPLFSLVRKNKLLYRKLIYAGFRTIDDVKKVNDQNRLPFVPGIGPKAVKVIKEELAQREPGAEK